MANDNNSVLPLVFDMEETEPLVLIQAQKKEIKRQTSAEILADLMKALPPLPSYPWGREPFPLPPDFYPLVEPLPSFSKPKLQIPDATYRDLIQYCKFPGLVITHNSGKAPHPEEFFCLASSDSRAAEIYEAFLAEEKRLHRKFFILLLPNLPEKLAVEKLFELASLGEIKLPGIEKQDCRL